MGSEMCIRDRARSDSVGLKKLVPATKSEKVGEFSTKLHQIRIERIDEED